MSIKNPTLRRRTKELTECANDAKECQLLGYELKELGSLVASMAIHMGDLQRKIDSQAEHIKDLNEKLADRKTENCSEKPNNCEHITEDGVTCAKYPACDDCLDNPLNKLKGSERLVKGKDEPTTQTETQNSNLTFEKADERCKGCNHYKLTCDLFSEICRYEPKDEPQTEREIAKAIVHKMIDDAVIAEDAYPDLRQKMHDAVDEYEPQTDCAWK